MTWPCRSDCLYAGEAEDMDGSRQRTRDGLEDGRQTRRTVDVIVRIVISDTQTRNGLQATRKSGM